MRPGKHHRKITSSRWLQTLETLYFIPKLFPYGNLKGSCGTTALATITGINPKTIDRQMPKTNDYWTDLAIKKFLRSRGYEVTEITVSRVTQCPNWQEDPITEKHVLLISQEILQGEGTWAVIHEGMRHHNFESDSLNPFEFINNPLTAVYAISHPKWFNMPPKNKIKFNKRIDTVSL